MNPPPPRAKKNPGKKNSTHAEAYGVDFFSRNGAEPGIQVTFFSITNDWAIHNPWTRVYDIRERLFQLAFPR